MISLYTFYFVLLEIRYRKKPREAEKVSSEDKAKQAKAKKCDKKSKTKQRKMFKENPYHLATLTLKSWFGKILACVAWRFCRAGRRSGVAAKFAREARENERRSREKNKNRLPGFVAFSTAAPFNSFWHPVDNLFGFSFPSQSEIKCWQPKHDTKARDIV